MASDGRSREVLPIRRSGIAFDMERLVVESHDQQALQSSNVCIALPVLFTRFLGAPLSFLPVALMPLG